MHFHTRWGLRPLAAALPASESLHSRSPCAARQRLWRRLCLGSMVFGDGMEGYCELAGKSSSADEQIRRDIGRTFPEAFDGPATEALFRVLRAVSHRLEDIGYCQGMNFVAGVFMRVFGTEALVYHCVISIHLRHGMNQYFGDRFPKLRLTALQFDCLVEAFFPELSATFDVFNLSAEFYATQWFLTLFAYSLPFPHVLRVWDQFLCRGMKFIHRVGLALLQEALPELLGLTFDSTVKRLRNIGQRSSLSPEALVAAALEFKVTNRLLSELEHAMTAKAGATEHGSRSLPVCFLERNLNSGRAKWRGAASSAASSAAASSCATTAMLEASAESVSFLDGALPAPRIPADPLAPCLERFGDRQADQLIPSLSKQPRQKTKVLKTLPVAMMNKARRPTSASTGERKLPGEPKAAEPPRGQTCCEDVGAPSKPTSSQERASSSSRNFRSLVRASSVPSLRQVPAVAFSRKAPSRPPTDAATSSDGHVGEAMSSTSNRASNFEAIPMHLRPFAVHDLDTGQWTLLGDAKAPDAAKQKSRRRVFSPARRLGLALRPPSVVRGTISR